MNPKHEAIMWNPWNKVVQDHRNGRIYKRQTNHERKKRGLKTPWTPDCGEFDNKQPASYQLYANRNPTP